ncbi:hypothetical protein GUJ93_ZPchr0014g46770 [Zizania palustris]|uniref:Uncharacterized protein n=1 Tax=Zizania palustris TaxID=103762 RepID=A0A8J5TFM9_ZIZPA|nr:hypothetical protein GUJ93_ZPchr0014g46770 [Zizania palustris]
MVPPRLLTRSVVVPCRVVGAPGDRSNGAEVPSDCYGMRIPSGSGSLGGHRRRFCAPHPRGADHLCLYGPHLGGLRQPSSVSACRGRAGRGGKAGADASTRRGKAGRGR